MFKILKALEREGAKDIVLMETESERSHLKFVNDIIIAPMRWEQRQLDIFFSYKGRIVATTVQKIPSPKEFASKIVRFAARLPENKDFRGIAHGPFTYPHLRIFDRRVPNLDAASPEMVHEAILAARREGASRSSGVFDYGTTTRAMLTGEGVDTQAKQTGLYFSIRSFSDKDASGHQVRCGCSPFSLTEAGAEAGRIAALAKNPGKLAPGRYTVVFEPMAFANFVDHVGAAASMFSVEVGISFLGGKIGTKVASPKLTIDDDGTLADGYHSSPFDNEGHPTRRTPLIAGGTLKHYLYNASLARKYGEKSTGNAGLISPEPWNLVVKKGRYNNEQLIAEVGNGILVTNLWYTRFQNYLTGQFSTVPRDGVFLIRDGAIASPVHGIRISDTMHQILGGVMALSKNPIQVLSWETEHPVLTPKVAVEGVNITASTS